MLTTHVRGSNILDLDLVEEHLVQPWGVEGQMEQSCPSRLLSDFALVNLVETWCETVSCCVSVKMFP